ncbi:hypothetical protein RvY_17512 [Ramazzottius varieornatus]|uniref:SAM-dependent MTase RsmB/NOP-type domain-containing protein n=1 Tax=Ramazzottius varieornatus TaxID=947166 RepID=A0A1D1W4J3_RAMVA|nr:hypothetical protein RvY_17512 [Ramazzottius varieornatus]
MSEGEANDVSLEDAPAAGKPQNKAERSSTGDITTDVYAAAAECLDAVLKGRASVKSAIFNSPFPEKRFLMAITQKTMDNLVHIKRIAYKSNLLKQETRLSKSMAYVLIYDLLFGEMKRARGIAGLIWRYRKALNEEMQKYLKENEVQDVSQLKKGDQKGLQHPRYIRVNTILSSRDEVEKTLKNEGFILKEYEAQSQKGFLKSIRKMGARSFYHDYHVPNVVVLNPMINFYNHELEKTGKIVVQDKASCLASLLLNPPAGSTVIDACAAPGMKTSHLAALMENQGKIFAVDLDAERCKRMEKSLQHYGVTCATTINEDFLKISPQNERFSAASHILVDPTCSGSGVTSRTNKQNRQSKKEERERLQKLKHLQMTLLKHALSFPNVQRVVYATCSISPEEDEEVVQEALKSNSQFILRPYSKYLPKWKGCGKPRYSVGPNCLRSFPEKHLTNGFFVAVMERYVPLAQEEGLVDGEVKEVGDSGKAEPGENGEVKIEQPVTDWNPAKDKRRKRKRKHEDTTEHWSAEKSSQSKPSAKRNKK